RGGGWANVDWGRGLRLADRGGPEPMSEGEVEIGRGDGRGGGARATTAQLALHLVARPGCEIPLRAEADPPQEEDRGVADRLEAGLDVAGELRGGRGRCRRLRRRGRGERTRERQERRDGRRHDGPLESR